MAKKRQQDFTKTHVKPGRMLTRRSQGNLAIKSKKIVVPKRVCSQRPVSSILDFLSKKTGQTAVKLSALQQIECLDSKEMQPLIAEIFEVITKLITEPDAVIRNSAIKILKKIFEENSEALNMKILSFRRFFINVLDSAMSNAYAKVKESTLIFMNIILKHCPNLICNSMQILKSFQNMIGLQLRKVSYQSSSKSSNVPILQEGQINHENYRMQVLDTLRLFLKEMLKNLQPNTVEENYDQNEIHWNGEAPLHLEIFAGSGLKPVDIEKSVVDCFDSEEFDFKDPSVIYDYIIPIVHLVRQTFLEELPSNMKADDTHFQHNTIQNLSILLQVLYELSELTESVPCEELVKEIRSFLLDDIYKRNLFPFHIIGFFDTNQRPETAELNLAVCFLHSKFLLEDECGKEYNSTVMSYIMKVFQMTQEIKMNSIPMLVKILKMYFGLMHIDGVSEFIIGTLGHMSNLLRNPRGYPSKQLNKQFNKDMLISLFIKLSLHPAYDFLLDTIAMKNWFHCLLMQLIDIPISNTVNKKLLRITKIIANRKYPSFSRALAGIDNNKYKALLKYDDPNVRDTVIFMIYNLDEVKGSLLEDISNVILLDSSFPKQYTFRFIRLLTSRFKEKFQSKDLSMKKGRTNFIQFLLNVAIDSLNLTSEKWFDYEANEYMQAMEPFRDVTTYNVYPSLQWKEHSKLFEVCQKSLSLLPQKLVNNVIMLMFKEILDQTRNLPVHSTIAILKLNSQEIKDRHYRFQIDDLIFSSLFTISILTYKSIEDEWYQYNVVELMDSVQLSRRIALTTLERQLENMEELSGIAAYNILRICKVYRDRQLFDPPEDGERVLNILEGYKERCPDESFRHQPLFGELYDYFYYYA